MPYWLQTHQCNNFEKITADTQTLCCCLQGVYAILAADPSVQESVLELLLPHFELFVQPEGPPLRLDACACLQVRCKYTFWVLPLPQLSAILCCQPVCMALQLEYCCVRLCAMTVQTHYYDVRLCAMTLKSAGLC